MECEHLWITGTQLMSESCVQERARRRSHSTCVGIQRKKSQSQSQQIVEPWFAQQQRVVVVSALQHSFRTSSLFLSFLDRQRDPNVTRTLGTSKGNKNRLRLLFCCKRWVAAGCCWYAADGIWIRRLLMAAIALPLLAMAGPCFPPLCIAQHFWTTQRRQWSKRSFCCFTEDDFEHSVAFLEITWAPSTG